MADAKYIDRTLEQIRFITDRHHFECYLHENELDTKRFAVVEQHAKGNTAAGVRMTDDQEQAVAWYMAAKARVLANIADALKSL
jgi:hypothetical protein